MNSPVLNSPTFISSFLNSAPGLSGNHPEAGIQRATQYHCRHPQVVRRGLRGRVYFQRAAAPRRFCIYVHVRVCTMLKDTPARAGHSQIQSRKGRWQVKQARLCSLVLQVAKFSGSLAQFTT